MLRKLIIAAAMVVTAATGVMAEGLDEINPDVAKRLYSKDMLDPMQPIGPARRMR